MPGKREGEGERPKKKSILDREKVHKLKSTSEKENNHGREVTFRRKHS